MAKNDGVSFLTCKAMNVKEGTTANGNPYRRFGLKVQDGPRKGEWVNYFRVVTEKTLPYYRQDCAAMGVTNDTTEDFQCDGRLVTVKMGPSTNPKMAGKEDVVGVLPYDASKVRKEVSTPVEDNNFPF